MTLTFRLSSKQSDGQAELLARFYEGTASFRAKSRIHVAADLWDDHAQRLVLPPRVTNRMHEVNTANEQIGELVEHIAKQWQLDRYAYHTSAWLQNTIDAFYSIASTSSKSITLDDAVRAYAQARVASAGTYRNIMVLAHALEQYNKPIAISGVTTEYVRIFAEHLYSYLAPNTVKKMLSQLRSVCNDAVDKEMLARSPFGGAKGYTIGTPIYGSPMYLTRDERDHLAQFPNLPPKIAVQRDIFIFQCYCGCRVSDLLLLTRANIRENGVLEYIAKKTSNTSGLTVRVPLAKVALDIIEKYKHTMLVRGRDDINHEFAEYVDDPSYLSPTLLPFMSAQTYNESIHTMFALAGLTRSVTILDKHTGKPTTSTLDAIASSHIARKTFSQLVYHQSGSERIAASFTGHSPNSRAFARYNEVDESMQRAVIEKI